MHFRSLACCIVNILYVPFSSWSANASAHLQAEWQDNKVSAISMQEHTCHNSHIFSSFQEGKSWFHILCYTAGTSAIYALHWCTCSISIYSILLSSYSIILLSFIVFATSMYIIYNTNFCSNDLNGRNNWLYITFGRSSCLFGILVNSQKDFQLDVDIENISAVIKQLSLIIKYCYVSITHKFAVSKFLFITAARKCMYSNSYLTIPSINITYVWQSSLLISSLSTHLTLHSLQWVLPISCFKMRRDCKMSKGNK